MMSRRPLRRCLAAALFAGALSAGCSSEIVSSRLQTGSPISGAVESMPTATAEDSGWQPIDAAMELRQVRLAVDDRLARFTMVRFDPNAYTVRVKYDVANAGSIRQWYEALDPLAVINGGYFDQNGKPTALVVFDGIRRGESYDGFGGMVVINAQGEFELRSLRQQPFDPNETIQQAMQSSPMLIQPGGTLSELETDTDRSRRSVIARDIHGRILLIVCQEAAWTLSELARGLKESDLELDAALNLDGGRSTGLYVGAEAATVRIDSFDQLPLVLVVERQS